MTVAAPRQSYLIWFSQRVGSSMLTQALEDTGIAGRPREWLEDPAGHGLPAKYGVRDAVQLRDFLWREAATPNGVMGSKYGIDADGHLELTALFAGIIPGVVDPDGSKAWEAVFPACKHVFMTRRNKLRPAVSWLRAIRSQEWHRPNRADTVFGEAPPRTSAADVIHHYDYDDLDFLLMGINRQEAEMQDQFDRWGVVPYTVVYEDLVADYDPTVRQLLDFLEIPGHADITIPRPALDRLADEASEDWYQRFRRGRAARS
ncbi:Stf0 family sulfotransferase [Actinopolymorpha sp. B17G11]|uniref:Stf0 family sulfotransferase n=1 Tax=Actinopolymorpha sp. B17G11 TaxID=3160861 RepID=UPI0032E3E263